VAGIEPAALEQPLHASGDSRQHDADLLVRRRRQRPEIERTTRAIGVEDAVEQERVVVDVQIESAPEALNHRHRSRSSIADSVAGGHVRAGSRATRARTRRAPRARVRDPTPANSAAGTARSAPTGARAPAEAPRRPGARRTRTC